MKNILFSLTFLLTTAVAFAQPNNQINLQGVVRDANGRLMPEQKISLKISLLEGSATGSPVWVELSASNSVVTNKFGVFNYAIGSGTPQGAYVFNNIDWTTKKFAKIEMDPLGGLNFTNVSTEELKSVPFANFAQTSFGVKLPYSGTTTNAPNRAFTVMSSGNDGMAGITTSNGKSGVYAEFRGTNAADDGNGVYAFANKKGKAIYAYHSETFATAQLGMPDYSGHFSGKPVLIDNRSSGASLQVAGAKHTYMEFYPQQTTRPGVRGAAIGFPGDDLTYLLIQNDFSNGDINYKSGVGGQHKFLNGPLNVIGGSGEYGGFNVGGTNTGLELHSTSAGLPYIDFTKDVGRDYDMRLSLDATNILGLSGGQLRINGSIPQNMPSFAYYAKNVNDNGTRTGPGSGNYPISLYAAQVIAAVEFYAFSDKRIKKDFKLSIPEKDLSLLTQLEVTDYKHVDFITKGNAYKKGFIAQQVEQIFPEAVSKNKDFIPNIYQPAAKATVEGDALRIDMATAHGFVKGDKVRFYVGNKMYELEVANTEGVSFTINNWKEKDAKEVFVYGKEVNDFRTVDYDRIFTLNVSATQALIKRNQDLEKRVAELEKSSSDLQNGLKSLEGKVGVLLKQSNTEGVTTTQTNPYSLTSKTQTNEK